MNNIFFKMRIFTVLVALVASSIALATNSLLTELDINADMESLTTAQSVSFSISPVSQPIRVRQLNNYLLSRISVDNSTYCSLIPAKNSNAAIINEAFSGISDTPKSVFKKGYSLLFGTHNYFQINLTGPNNDQLVLGCYSESYDLPKYSQFQKAFALYKLNLSVSFSE